MSNLSKYLIGFICLLLLWAGYANHRENVLKQAMTAKDNADKATIAAALSDQKKSDAKYDAQIHDLESLKQKTVTVTQIVHALPQVITLPAPVHEVTQKQADAANAADPTAPKEEAGDIDVPAADAKPLFDAQVNFKECLANLAKTETRYTDLQKIDTAKDDQIKQRDIVIAGGSKGHRLKSIAIIGGIGALIGGGVATYLEHK